MVCCANIYIYSIEKKTHEDEELGCKKMTKAISMCIFKNMNFAKQKQKKKKKQMWWKTQSNIYDILT